MNKHIKITLPCGVSAIVSPDITEIEVMDLNREAERAQEEVVGHDPDDYEEGDTLMQVAIGYDVHTKKGHIRAEDDIFFDVDQQYWYDNWGEGGPVTTLPKLLKVIKNHIRDNKKAITG